MKLYFISSANVIIVYRNGTGGTVVVFSKPHCFYSSGVLVANVDKILLPVNLVNVNRDYC